MKILHTDIYRFSIPMIPFTIATGNMHYAQNLFIRIHTDAGFYGVGECSAFPMIAGETQATCFEMAKEFATLWKDRDPLAIEERMQQLHAFTAFNATAKSAFDMALYDISARSAGQPLYRFLGGQKVPLETDLTIGIDEPDHMAAKALDFKNKGVRIIKVKLGKDGRGDLEKIQRIRTAVGEEILLRIDANQGWDFDTAANTLKAMEPYNIQFCEQPMRAWADDQLPELRSLTTIPLMADESVFNHHDANRLIKAGACDAVNIKFAKSGGILEALEIARVCGEKDIPCMMGGMLESRIALTAFAHFASSQKNIVFYDMDTCLLGHKIDPVKGGVQYNGYFLELTEEPGLGVDAADNFLSQCIRVRV